MKCVSLPVDPGAKTRGEVATLQLVRRKTDVPVPRVIAFDDGPLMIISRTKSASSGSSWS
jgi:hypothetical protein